MRDRLEKSGFGVEYEERWAERDLARHLGCPTASSAYSRSASDTMPTDERSRTLKMSLNSASSSGCCETSESAPAVEGRHFIQLGGLTKLVSHQ